MPDLDFEVVDAEVVPYAAGPTLLFRLSIKNAVLGEQIHSVMLRVQIRIEATKRTYDAEAKAKLRELFGDPEQFGSTVKSLHWTNVVQTVPPFAGSVVTDLPVVCTYDFDVVGAKYLYALESGEVPLLFLFSGTILYSREGSGLQISQISWEKEAAYRMPIRFWKDTMERYFPNSAWIRVRKDLFDRLYLYKGRNTLINWEDVFERLLQNEPEGGRRA